MKVSQLFESKVDMHTLIKPIIKDIPENKVKKFEDAVLKIQKGIDAGEIFNADYVDAKDTIGRIYEQIFGIYYWDNNKKFPHGPATWFHQDAYKETSWDVDSYLSSQSIRKTAANVNTLVKLGKGTEYAVQFNEMKRVADSFAAVVPVLKELKSKTVKGRRPKEVDPNAPVKFSSKIGSDKAIKLVTEAFKEMLTPLLDDYQKQYEAMLDKDIKRLKSLIKEKNGQLQRDEYKKPGDLSMPQKMIFQDIFTFSAQGNFFVDIKPNAKIKTYAADEAAKVRDSIEKTFLSKNIRKLSAIIDSKSGKIKIEDQKQSNVTSNTIQCIMKFSFEDNSEFIVNNKIMINRSSTGKEFYQYPTTFHDVKMSDGTKLASPSEEKMVSQFK